MNLDQALSYLKESKANGRMAHAWVLAGPPRGEGGRLAERILQMLVCEETDGPCGECRPCGQVAGRTHPDVLWVEPQLKSRRIAVDHIRNLQQFVFQTSFLGGWKGCVILGADRLSDDAANSFLKTLEEPPARCVFLLVTDSPALLLPTVISRCRRIDVSAAETVVEDGWTGRLLDILRQGGAAGAGRAGQIARCVALLKEMKKEAAKLVEKEPDSDDDDEVVDARISARHIEMRASLLKELSLWYRDLMVLACGGAEDLVYHRKDVAVLRKESERLTVSRALANMELVEGMRRQLERNLPEDVALTAGFLKMQ